MNAPLATDRARVDALFVELVDAIRLEGFGTIADLLLVQDSDTARVAALIDQADLVKPLTGRRIFIRFAMPWVAHALDAMAEGDAGAAGRWTKLAGYELERYRSPEGGQS